MTYTIPETGDEAWGNDTTGWIVAITANALQKTGGTYSLTADLDLGAAFGLKSIYYKSRSADIAGTGVVRLAHADAIKWRNDANTEDLNLQPNSDDELEFNLDKILTADGVMTFTNKQMDDSLLAQNIATPSTPPSGYSRVYFKTDKQLYQLDDTGTETSLFPSGSTFSTFDTTYSADPTGTVAHSLGGDPDLLMVSYEDVASSGIFRPLLAANYLTFDGTNFYLDFTGVTISATNRIRINGVRFL